MKRTISRWLALVYTLTNVFCVYAGESNYWEERRQAVQRRSSPTRLASFNVSRSAELVATGPSASLQTQLPGQLMPASHRALLPGMEKDWGWLPELVANYGDIREIHVASRPDAPVVIHLQDVHDLEEAQKNLAGLVESLRAKRGISLVGLEGALGSFELDFFREGPLDVRKKLSDRFLNLGYLTGPEVAGIIAEKPPTLWGIEDVELYRGHVEAFEQSESGRAQVRQFLTTLTVEADKARETFYSPALRALDDHRRAYMSHQKSLGDYVPALWSAQKGVKKAYPQVALLVKLLAQEQTLDFKEVERQRVRLAEVLAQRLSPEELDRLVKASMAYRSGRQTAGAYQKYLANVCRHNNIRLDTFGSLASYMDYVQVADPLDSGKLLDELDRLELAALTGTAETNEEKKLVDVFRGLALVDKLTNHGLTPQEWRVLKKDDLSLEHIRSVLTQISPTSVSKTVSLPDLSPYKEFCLKAEQRNNALVKNLLAKMKTEKVNSAVLVAGGFHTEGMTALLKEANASYVVITPEISKVPDTRPLDIFVRAPLPLEKLLAGDVIHLAYPRLTQNNLEAIAAAKNAPERRDTLIKAWLLSLKNGKEKDGKSTSGLMNNVRSALTVVPVAGLLKEIRFFIPPVLGVLAGEFVTAALGLPGGAIIHVLVGLMVAIFNWPDFRRHHAKAETQWLRDNPEMTTLDYRRNLLIAYSVICLVTVGAMVLFPSLGGSPTEFQGPMTLFEEMGRAFGSIVVGGFLFHGIYNFTGRLITGAAFVPAMGFWPSFRNGRAEQLLVETGGHRHVLYRDIGKRTAAHIQIPNEPNRQQDILVQLPAAQSAIYLPVHSDSPWSWETPRVQTTRPPRNNFGVQIDFRSIHSNKITLELSRLLLMNVVSMRMQLFYNRPIRQEEQTFLHGLQQLSGDDRKLIQDLVPEPLENIIEPRIQFLRDRSGNVTGVEIKKTTFDGRNHFWAIVEFPADVKAQIAPNGDLLLEGLKPIEMSLRLSSDSTPLTPIPFEKIFTPQSRQAMNKDPLCQESAKRFSTLVFKEKLLAGSWMYPAYFGRDTLLASRLMWPALTMSIKENIVQSVLDRLGQFSVDESPEMDGWVAVSDERNGEYLFHGTIVEFNRLIAAGEFSNAADVLRQALLGARSAPEHHVLDGNVLLTGVLSRFLHELSPSERQRFLDARNARGESNLESILAHANVLLRLAGPYAEALDQLRQLHPGDSLSEIVNRQEFRQTALSLVGIQPDPRGDRFIGNWRDSAPALGYGRYPADINAFLMPSALSSLDEIFDLLGRSSSKMSKRVEGGDWPLLKEVLKERAVLSRVRDAWSTAIIHFQVTLTKNEVRRRLKNYMEWDGLSSEEKRNLGLRQLDPGISVRDFLADRGDPSWLKRGFAFTAVSLDAGGNPVPIVNSDEVFLMLENNLPLSETRRLLDFWSRPFPIGLQSEAGLLIANPVFTDNPSLWGALGRRSYHGTVVWGWVVAAIGMGLARQYKYSGTPPDQEKILRALAEFSTLWKFLGSLAGLEAWSWVVKEGGRMSPVELVHGAESGGSGQPAVPIQLWSANAISVDPILLDASSQMRIGERYSNGTARSDRIWEKLLKEGSIPSRLVEKWRLLGDDARHAKRFRLARLPRDRRFLKDLQARGPPGGFRVAFLHFTAPPRVSGVDIVMTEQARWLARMGVPVKVVAGNRSTEFESVANLSYSPIEGLSMMEEGEIDGYLQKVFGDQDVIVLHNVMSVPLNFALTASLHKYILGHPEKQFIVFVHNAMEKEEAHYPYSLMNPDLSVPQVTYVTVSEAYRDVIARSYPRAPPFEVVPPGLWSYNPDSLTPEAVDDFFQNGLFGQDLVLLFPTRVDWNKDIPKAFQITKALARQRPKTKLIMVIPGVSHFDDLVRETRSNRDSGAADWLERNMREIANEHVVFLDATRIGGYRRHRQYVSDLVALSDAMLMPSRMESFGMPAVEAASVRTVVAASNLSPHIETVGQGSPLFSIEEPPEVIADRIQYFVDQHPPHNLGAQQENAIERFEWGNVMGKRFLPLLEKAVESLPRVETAVKLFQRGEKKRAQELANRIFQILAQSPETWRDVIGNSRMAGIPEILSEIQSNSPFEGNPELANLQNNFFAPAFVGLANEFPSDLENVSSWLGQVHEVVSAIHLLTNDHRHTIALNTLGHFHRISGRPENALSAYLEVKRIDPGNQVASAGLKAINGSPRGPGFKPLFVSALIFLLSMGVVGFNDQAQAFEGGDRSPYTESVLSAVDANVPADDSQEGDPQEAVGGEISDSAALVYLNNLNSSNRDDLWLDVQEWAREMVLGTKGSLDDRVMILNPLEAYVLLDVMSRPDPTMPVDPQLASQVRAQLWVKLMAGFKAEFDPRVDRDDEESPYGPLTLLAFFGDGFGQKAIIDYAVGSGHWHKFLGIVPDVLKGHVSAVARKVSPALSASPLGLLPLIGWPVYKFLIGIGVSARLAAGIAGFVEQGVLVLMAGGLAWLLGWIFGVGFVWGLIVSTAIIWKMFPKAHGGWVFVYEELTQLSGWRLKLVETTDDHIRSLRRASNLFFGSFLVVTLVPVVLPLLGLAVPGSLEQWFFAGATISSLFHGLRNSIKPTTGKVAAMGSAPRWIQPTNGDSIYRVPEKGEWPRINKALLDQTDEILKSLKISARSTVCSIGPGGRIDNTTGPYGLVLERQALITGSQVHVFERFDNARGRWTKFSDDTLIYGDSLHVHRDVKDAPNSMSATADAVFAFSVFASPQADQNDREATLLKALDLLKPGGHLVVGWYNREPLYKFKTIEMLNSPLVTQRGNLELVKEGNTHPDSILFHGWAIYKWEPFSSPLEKSAHIETVAQVLILASLLWIAVGATGFGHSGDLMMLFGALLPLREIFPSANLPYDPNQPISWGHGSEHPGSAVVIGDADASFEAIKKILTSEGLVDEKDRWVGGRRVVVQVGDVVGRGQEPKELYEYLINIQAQARKAGGNLVLLLGNHEMALLMGQPIGGDFKENQTSVRDELRELLAQWVKNGNIQCAAVLANPKGEKYFVTHAGYSIKLRNLLPGLPVWQEWLESESPQTFGTAPHEDVLIVQKFLNQAVVEIADEIILNPRGDLNKKFRQYLNRSNGILLGSEAVLNRVAKFVDEGFFPIRQIIGHSVTSSVRFQDKDNNVINTDSGLYHPDSQPGRSPMYLRLTGRGAVRAVEVGRFGERRSYRLTNGYNRPRPLNAWGWAAEIKDWMTLKLFPIYWLRLHVDHASTLEEMLASYHRFYTVLGRGRLPWNRRSRPEQWLESHRLVVNKLWADRASWHFVQLDGGENDFEAIVSNENRFDDLLDRARDVWKTIPGVAKGEVLPAFLASRNYQLYPVQEDAKGQLDLALQHSPVAVSFQETGFLGVHEILIETDIDRIGLLADMTGAIAARGFSVLVGDVRVEEGVVLGRFDVGGLSMDASKRSEQRLSLENDLSELILGKIGVGDLFKRNGLRYAFSLTPGQGKPPSVVGFHDGNLTVLTSDRDQPGLLHVIARKLADLDCNISLAPHSIHTQGDTVFDFFKVVESNGESLSPQRKITVNNELKALLEKETITEDDFKTEENLFANRVVSELDQTIAFEDFGRVDRALLGGEAGPLNVGRLTASVDEIRALVQNNRLQARLAREFLEREMGEWELRGEDGQMSKQSVFHAGRSLGQAIRHRETGWENPLVQARQMTLAALVSLGESLTGEPQEKWAEWAASFAQGFNEDLYGVDEVISSSLSSRRQIVLEVSETMLAGNPTEEEKSRLHEWAVLMAHRNDMSGREFHWILPSESSSLKDLGEIYPELLPLFSHRSKVFIKDLFRTEQGKYSVRNFLLAAQGKSRVEDLESADLYLSTRNEWVLESDLPKDVVRILISLVGGLIYDATEAVGNDLKRLYHLGTNA